MKPFTQLTVIAPGILHIDMHFTRRTLPFTYDFVQGTVLHRRDDQLIQSTLDLEWLKRFASHMRSAGINTPIGEKVCKILQD